MKLSELRPCDACGGALAPIFVVVRTSLAVFNQRAVNSTLGMTRMFGNTPAALAIAEVMGAEPEVVKIAGEEDPKLWNEAFLCLNCHTMESHNVAMLTETAEAKKASHG